MSDIDVVLEGRAFVDGEIRYTEVGISEEGRIVAAGNYVSGGERRVELGTSQIMVPAFIDPHVHFRDPGMTAKEDFGTGTMAAVHAGVSCVFDMPNTKPPVPGEEGHSWQEGCDRLRTVRGRDRRDKRQDARSARCRIQAVHGIHDRKHPPG